MKPSEKDDLDSMNILLSALREEAAATSLQELHRLFDADLTAPQAIDYWLVHDRGHRPTDAADIRGVGRQTVNNNLRISEAKLHDKDLPESLAKRVGP